MIFTLRKKFSIAPLLILLSIGSPLRIIAQSNRAHAILISVATKHEKHWANIHAIAQAAAKDLNVDLEILFAERDHVLATQMAHEISARENKPDYVIVVGEKLIASKSIPVLSDSGIKVFMYGSLTEEEKGLIGDPLQKYPNYLGKVSIDDYMAGYLTAELLVKTAIKKELYDGNGDINILGLEGVHKTSFNSERVRGLNDLLEKYPQVRMIQSVPTNWSEEDAMRLTPLLLRRHSKYKIAGFWCANSRLALGASDAMKLLGKTPGVDFITVGTDWGSNAVKSVREGDVLGIAGGHIAAIAWIVTLIHDHHNGINLESGMYLSGIAMMGKSESIKFLKSFEGENWDMIDFVNYSKSENSQIKEYDFNFKLILDDLGQ